MEQVFENAKSGSDFELAARLQYVEIPKSQEALQDLVAQLSELENDSPFLCQVVGAREIADVLGEWTGIPAAKMLSDDRKRLLSIEQRISSRVFGQDEGIKVLSKAVKRSRAGVNDPNKPIGVFLFLGPTGVGKTETAKALAEELFDDESKLIRIDMSEYMESFNVSRLVGSPPGYAGHETGGELTDAIRNKPYSVVLFDEIEKAHPKVLDILLQVFDDGRLTDGRGRLADFKQSIIILTSNIAFSKPLDMSQGEREAMRKALSQELRPELVNRIDEIVKFKSLTEVEYRELLNKSLEQLNSRLNEKDLRIAVGEELEQKIIERALSGQFGGRGLNRAFQELVIDTLTDRLIEVEGWTGAWVLEYDQFGVLRFSEDVRQHRFLPPAK